MRVCVIEGEGGRGGGGGEWKAMKRLHVIFFVGAMGWVGGRCGSGRPWVSCQIPYLANSHK